jgi:3-oxoacyl-[acyl-carrier-protein] synthase-3
MAKVTISGVRVSGIAASVPKSSVSNLDFDLISPADRQKLINTTGIESRRLGPNELTTADLCFEAAKKLLESTGASPAEVEALLFVTQTPDYYFVPATAPVLQSRLGLPKSTVAFDITLGCSGYTYGMYVLASLLASGRIKRGLLLAGDTPSKTISPRDKSAAPLFGDAGSATLLTLDPSAPDLHFDLGSDGGGYKAIMVESGGFRHPVDQEALKEKDLEPGISRSAVQLALDGVEVFNFSLREVPKTVKALLEFTGADPGSVDVFVFHQANMLMNEMIRKKLAIPAEKVPYSLKDFGNTSSASIPLSLVTARREMLSTGKVKTVACGFGVGLSWASLLMETQGLVVPQLVEV